MNTNVIYNEDALEGLKKLPDKCIQTCVTSPPYFNLRDYGVNGQIGLEDTPEEYVDKLVQLFREVRRVLRDDGTLWLNLGDSYNGSQKGGNDPKYQNDYSATCKPTRINLKQKDLIGIPWMVAFALRADGWYLRQDIIWHKPNPMPESVTDRCTKSHEYIFLFSKSPKYYYDNEAVKEPTVYPTGSRPDKVRGDFKGKYHAHEDFKHISDSFRNIRDYRNKRSVWTVPTKPFSEAHFAVFPQDLIEPCIMAGSSDMACEICGSPWIRVLDKKTFADTISFHLTINDILKTTNVEKSIVESWFKPYTSSKFAFPNAEDWKKVDTDLFPELLGNVLVSNGFCFVPICTCDNEGTSSSIVLDPFMGSGTTAVTALKHRRQYLGFELNPEYVKLAEKRIKENPGPPIKKITDKWRF